MRVFKRETSPFQKKVSDPKLLWEFSHHHEQGVRPTMEDAVAIKEYFGENAYNLLLAVFDGHSGSRCAQFLQETIPEEIVKHPKFGKSRSQTTEALKEAYFSTDTKWLRKAKEKAWEDGSTALSVLILNNILYVANTGDCRAVMCKGGNSVILSKDHKPDVPEERNRIESRGGNIIGGRVQGQLGVSRSFGDYLYKEKENLTENYLDCEPEINSYILTPDTDFIVIGCDGLYDEIPNEDIIEFVKKRLLDKQSVQNICKELVNEALERGSKDNVTAIILKFEKLFKKKLQQAKKVKESENKIPLNKTMEIKRAHSDSKSKKSKEVEDTHSEEIQTSKPIKRNSKSNSSSDDKTDTHQSNESPSSEENKQKLCENGTKDKNNLDQLSSRKLLPYSLSSESYTYKRETKSVDIDRKKLSLTYNNIKKDKEGNSPKKKKTKKNNLEKVD